MLCITAAPARRFHSNPGQVEDRHKGRLSVLCCPPVCLPTQYLHVASRHCIFDFECGALGSRAARKNPPADAHAHNHARAHIYARTHSLQPCDARR
jgi:hypothetical protein